MATWQADLAGSKHEVQVDKIEFADESAAR